MSNQNWLVTDDGQYRPFGHPHVPEPGQYYRLYRFLTDLEDILATFHDDISRLEAITPLVRKLLLSSYWLKTTCQPPSPNTGWATHSLYQEHDFPLTLQMMSWLPGHRSPLHTHATWGIIALISGQERHELWRRSPQPHQPEQAEQTQELILHPGDVIAFTSHTSHSVAPLGDEPTVAFGLYGAPRVEM